MTFIFYIIICISLALSSVLPVEISNFSLIRNIALSSNVIGKIERSQNLFRQTNKRLNLNPEKNSDIIQIAGAISNHPIPVINKDNNIKQTNRIVAFRYMSNMFESDIWTIEEDGTNLKQVTKVGEVVSFSWSPDGNRIAFLVHGYQNMFSEIFLINSDGSNIVQLTLGANAWNAVIDWHDTKIAFLHYTNVWPNVRISYIDINTPNHIIELSPDSRAYVYVYDSNLPGNDEHRIEFDFTDEENDKWYYDWPIPLRFDIRIEGDKSQCLLNVTPLEMYRHRGIAWWEVEGYTTARMIAVWGDANLLFTDDEGRRLGFDEDGFHDEIPGASYLPLWEESGENTSQMYYLPNDLLYRLQVNGKGAGTANIQAWSQDNLVELSNLDVMTGTMLTLSIPDQGSSITLSEIFSSTKGSLSISKMISDEERTFSIHDLAFHPGDQVNFQMAISDTLGYSDTIRLSTNSPISSTYNLSLQRAGGDGYSVFGHSSLVLDPLSALDFEIADWSQMGEINIFVDLQHDGYIDDIRSASNETAPKAISFEPTKKSMYTGGNQIKIYVLVKDQNGAYVANGTPLSLDTSLGSLSEEEAFTSGGLVEVILSSGDLPGTATITATSGDIQASINIEFLAHQIFLPSILNSP